MIYLTILIAERVGLIIILAFLLVSVPYFAVCYLIKPLVPKFS